MTHPYATSAYAESLPHIGRPFSLPEWGGHVLVRDIPTAGRQDATGPYPLCAMEQDADVAGGLERLQASGCVSLVMVASDGLTPGPARLETAFDFVRAYKTHYVFDPALGPPVYAKHHRYEVKRAHARVAAAEVRLADHLQAWSELYEQLAARHQVGALHAFTGAHHQTLARLDGVRTFAAFVEDRLVSAHIFVVDERRAISHLAASSAEGYAAGAAYAVNDLARRELGQDLTINFGGAAGFGDNPADGLARFKKGFANTTSPAYLCGKVLDAAIYETLSRGAARGGFFPAYRSPRQEELSDVDPG